MGTNDLDSRQKYVEFTLAVIAKVTLGDEDRDTTHSADVTEIVIILRNLTLCLCRDLCQNIQAL